MNKLIETSKEVKWKQVCEETEDDIWLIRYQRVRKINVWRNLKLNKEMEHKVIEHLFPVHNINIWSGKNVSTGISDVTEEEMNSYISSLKGKKPPGPNGITTEILKTTYQICHPKTRQRCDRPCGI